MNVKKAVSILLILWVAGTAALFAQQSWEWNPEGQQCFSLAGVEYYYSKSDFETVFKNHNTYGVTVLYTKNGSQESLWINAGVVKRIGGRVTVDQCKR
jgi:hypothetical protein